LSAAFQEWRLGQMITNLAVVARGTKGEAIWDVEDMRNGSPQSTVNSTTARTNGNACLARSYAETLNLNA
jgi:hypothetical protein